MHTGPLIMGITGDEHRLDAATISDTVNTAARIESLTKHYRSPVLLSNETLQYIRDLHEYDLRPLGEVQLKGKNKLLSIFECLNGYPPGPLQKKRECLSSFQQAMDHYHRQRFDEAVDLFQFVLSNDPDDQTTGHFMENAIRYSLQGVPENWTGAELMKTK